VLAERVSEECGERIPVRSTVPFRDSQLHHHGGGGRSSKDDPNPFSVDGGAIHFVTYDVLLDAVKQDPLLSRYSVIVADDAHERALHGDLALGLLRQIQSSKKRSDLRVVVCSAGAVAAQALLQFFESKPSLSDQASSRNNMNRCCAISVDGQSQQTSPAAVVDVLHITNPTPNYLQGTLETCARILKAEDSMAAGHVLCFLPTRQAVDDAIRMASEQDGTWFPHQSVDLLPLYYDVNSLPSSSHRQLQALDFSKKRTIVFATSVAETSIT
jgi:HrpA-like RNA helicase